jgi:hypothetical protein
MVIFVPPVEKSHIMTSICVGCTAVKKKKRIKKAARAGGGQRGKEPKI